MCLYMSYDVDEPQFVPDLSPVFVLLDGQGNQGTPIFFSKLTWLYQHDTISRPLLDKST